MRLEKRDVAEALGLVYNGIQYEPDDKDNLHCFSFHGKDIYCYANRDIEEAWEDASEELLEPLVELLKERL